MKPTPPKPAWTPGDDAISAHQPIPSPLRIEDVSPFADPIAPPVLGTSSTEGSVLCDSCDRCWKMTVAGQFKNRKADGSEYVLTERFCVFKDSLVTLAERTVRECSRFVPKKEDGND